ncbi:hypothetical protein [Streptomyces sp. NPDC002324]
MPESAESFDPLTTSRVAIDLDPLQTGVPLARVESFGGFLGSASPAHAVWAAPCRRQPDAGGSLMRAAA